MKSKCCKAPLEVKGNVTKAHYCTKCGKDSDPIEWEENKLNEKAQKIIGILEGGEHLSVKCRKIERIITNYKFNSGGYLQFICKDESLIAGKDEISNLTNIHPLPDRREEEENSFSKNLGESKPLNKEDFDGLVEQIKKKSMTYPQIAKAAIDQAVEGGWDDGKYLNKWGIYAVSRGDPLFMPIDKGVSGVKKGIEIWIDKDWAKSFYGTHKVDEEGNEIRKAVNDEPYIYYSSKKDSIYVTPFCTKDYEEAKEAWEYHLKKQVMEDNHLDYIGGHLK